MYAEVTSALDRIKNGDIAGDVESETLDFKQDASDTKKTLEAVVNAAACFANADGGTVVLGVRDKVAGLDAFEGTQLDYIDVKQAIYNRTDPPLLADVNILLYCDVKLITASVPPGVTLHLDANGRYRHRVGSS